MAEARRYPWAKGSRLRKGLDPQAIGERFDAIRERGGGFLDPKAVVKDARDPASPLHDAFPWDVEIAAQERLLEVARLLIRSVRRIEIIVNGDGTQSAETRRVYVHVRPSESTPAYVPLTSLATCEEFREQALRDALAQIRAWRARYSELTEFAGIVREIDRVVRKHGAVAKSAKKKK